MTNFTKGATICDFYSIETGAALKLNCRQTIGVDVKGNVVIV